MHHLLGQALHTVMAVHGFMSIFVGGYVNEGIEC